MIFQISETLRQMFGEEKMIELVCSVSIEQLKVLAYG